MKTSDQGVHIQAIDPPFGEICRRFCRAAEFLRRRPMRFQTHFQINLEVSNSFDARFVSLAKIPFVIAASSLAPALRFMSGLCGR